MKGLNRITEKIQKDAEQEANKIKKEKEEIIKDIKDKNKKIVEKKIVEKKIVEKKLDSLPIASPLKVIDYQTIKKGSGWWLAVVLVESWQKRSIGLYLWQRKKDGRCVGSIFTRR